MRITETDLNRLAQRFHDVSDVGLAGVHDKPKVIEGLRTVFQAIGIEVEKTPRIVITRNDAGSVDIQAIQADGNTRAYATYKDTADYMSALDRLINTVL